MRRGIQVAAFRRGPNPACPATSIRPSIGPFAAAVVALLALLAPARSASAAEPTTEAARTAARELSAIVAGELGPAAAAARQAQRATPGWTQDASPNSLFIRFRNSTAVSGSGLALGPAPADVSSVLAALADGAGARETSRSSLTGIVSLRFDSSAITITEALRRIEALPEVEWAEPAWRRRLFIEPNDYYYPEQWGLSNTGQYGFGGSYDQPSFYRGVDDFDINAAAGWNNTRDAGGIVVAVIDTGIDSGHADLRDNIWTNSAETPGDGIDNDKNGYVDDIHGWDFVGNTVDDIVGDNDTTDQDGHGTASAGVIGARGDNGQGICGVAWYVRIMALKVGDADGFLDDNAINSAYAYAGTMGAKVVNASFGGYQYSETERSAISALSSRGVVVVAAAGNDNLDLRRIPVYPAAYNLSNIIAVASVNRIGLLSTFSNYGTGLVHVAAPGEGMLTTLPNYDVNPGNPGATSKSAEPAYDLDDNGWPDYGVLAGTSFAAPVVSGAVALLRAQLPSLTPAQIRERIINSCTWTPAFAPAAVSSGGILNLNALLSTTQPSLGLFSPRTVTVGDAAVTLSIGGNNLNLLNSGATIAPYSVVLSNLSFAASKISGRVSANPWSARGSQVSPVQFNGTSAVATPASGSLSIVSIPYTYSNSQNVTIPDGDSNGISSTLSVPDDFLIDSISVSVVINHSYFGNLVMRVEAPDGGQWTLANREGYVTRAGQDFVANISGTYPDTLHPRQSPLTLVGRRSSGTWKLHVSDNAKDGFNGYIDSWGLTLRSAWRPPVSGADSAGLISSGTIFPFAGTEQVGNSRIRAKSNSNCFGFLRAPADIFTATSTQLYRVDYTVATDVGNLAQVPLYRLRSGSADSQFINMHLMQKNGTGAQTPTTTGAPQTMYLSALPFSTTTAASRQFYDLAFDLLNLDAANPATASLDLRTFTVTPITISSLGTARLEKTYSFTSDAEGWTTGAAGTFSTPVFVTKAGSIGIRAINADDCFGFWTSPGDVALDSTRLYRLRWNLTTSTTDKAKVPVVRMRANDSDYLQGSMIVVNSVGDNSLVTTPAGRDYDLWYTAPASIAAGRNLVVSLDLLNFGGAEDPTGEITLNTLTIESFAKP